MGGSRERRRGKLFILLALGGILVMAALGFHLGPFYDGPASAGPVTGQGSSELTTSTRVQIPGSDNSPSTDPAPSTDQDPSADPTPSTNSTPSDDQNPSADSTPSAGPASSDDQGPATGPTPSAGPTPSVGQTTDPEDDSGGNEFKLAVTDVHAMFPGDRRPLRATFTNQHGFDVWVTELTTTVRGTPGCAARHLVTGTHSLHTRIHVPANSRAAGTVPFGMRMSAPDGCQGASFDLQVSATAVKK